MAAHPKPFLPLARITGNPEAKKNPGSIAHKSLPKRSSKRGPIAAAQAKAHFLQLLDQVDRKGETITITKRGRIVAQLVPAQPEQKISNFDRAYGSMTGTGKILGDIVSPNWEAWGPEWQ